jgi:hypothetical protein
MKISFMLCCFKALKHVFYIKSTFISLKTEETLIEKKVSSEQYGGFIIILPF